MEMNAVLITACKCTKAYEVQADADGRLPARVDCPLGDTGQVRTFKLAAAIGLGIQLAIYTEDLDR